MKNNESYGDEDFLEPYSRYEPDEDQAHDEYVDRVFEYDLKCVTEALSDGFFTQQDLLRKMTALLAKARREGNYPYV